MFDAGKIESMIGPSLEAMGYSVVRIAFTGGRRPTLQIMAERGDNAAMTVEDCETISHTVSALLDVADPIASSYVLEISSPGIDRPLRTAEHFRYFTGSEARIQLQAPLHLPAGERRNFKGILAGVEGNQVVIECDGTAFRLAIDDIEHAKLVPDWDAVMKGGSGAGKPAARPSKPGQRPSRKSASAEPRHRPESPHHASAADDPGSDAHNKER